MARLRGTGIGAGMALGTAAIVSERGGVPVFPAMPERLAALLASHNSTELPDVVLLAGSLEVALAALPSIRWANVVAIAAVAPSAAVPPIPSVVEIADLMRRAQDDVLVLVDAAHGVVWIDPDPVALAQYTQRHENIAPRRRFFLDSSHLPAVTLDGRTIHISCVTADSARPESFERALEAGPDELELEIPFEFDSGEYRRRLLAAVALSGGKPVTISWSSMVPMLPLLEASMRTELALAASLDIAEGPDVSPLLELAEMIAAAETAGIDADADFGLPRICAHLSISPDSPWPEDAAAAGSGVESLSSAGVTRLYLTLADVEAGTLARALTIVEAASPALITVYGSVASLVSGDTGALQLLLGVGCTGLFGCPPDETADLKNEIRSLDITICRELLRQRLSPLTEDAA